MPIMPRPPDISPTHCSNAGFRIEWREAVEHVVPIRWMELAVRPDEVQRASLRALQDGVAPAGELLKTDCPTYRPAASHGQLTNAALAA